MLPQPNAVLDDVCKLSGRTMTNHKNGKPYRVKKTKGCFHGFPCTDVSRKNNRRGESMDTVRDASLRTGK
eukprot:5057931-Karenia_brevis.AAC.1